MDYHKCKPIRVRIDQPSRLQPYHKYNGSLGMAVFIGDTAVFSFVSGPESSMEIPKSCLVLGWPKIIENSP